MGCSNSVKNPHFKSCERFYNNNVQSIDAGQTLQLQLAGSRVVDTGVSIDAEPMSYTTLTKGLYHISGDIVINVTTSGSAVFSVYMDGVQLPCTVKAINPVINDVSVHTETDVLIENCCCNIAHTFTFIIQSRTMVGEIVNCCTGITKLA